MRKLDIEEKILVTFCLSFIYGIVVCGISNVASATAGFFANQSYFVGSFYAFLYIIFLYIHTRKYPIIATLLLLAILLMVFFTSKSSSIYYDTYDWILVIGSIFYGVVITIVSINQSKILKQK